MKRKILLLFLFLLVRVSYAQQPITIQLTEKDKLPDNEFYDILEANNGIIWLAADKGLFKYNGKDFINFSNPDKRGLSVFGLCQDDKNRIWCNNISGQFFFVTNDKLELFIDLKDDLKDGLYIIRPRRAVVFSDALRIRCLIIRRRGAADGRRPRHTLRGRSRRRPGHRGRGNAALDAPPSTP